MDQHVVPRNHLEPRGSLPANDRGYLVILVCGGRDFADAGLMERTLNAYYERGPMSIVNGAASGADALSSSWARMRRVHYVEYPASWGIYGRRAGPIRNQYMLDVAKPDLVLAFPGGRGTDDMVRRAKGAGVEVVRLQSSAEPTDGPKGSHPDQQRRPS